MSLGDQDGSEDSAPPRSSFGIAELKEFRSACSNITGVEKTTKKAEKMTCCA